jgi:hypothetical protein
MFAPIAIQLVDTLIQQGIIAAEQRKQAIQASIDAMHTVKWPTLASDYTDAKAKLSIDDSDTPPDASGR